MTDEEQRIAIAEAVGWKRYHSKGEDSLEWFSPTGIFCLLEDLPDYLNDLNAMHEAMKTVIPRQAGSRWGFYARNLYRVVHGKDLDTPTCHLENYLVFDLINATARQRSEAFLKCLGKWKE